MSIDKIFSGIAFLGFTFLYAGFQKKNLILMSIGAGLILFFGGYALILYLRDKRQTKSYEKSLIAFKSSAKQIKVDLDKVEIFSNNWQEEKPKDDSRGFMMNYLMDDSERNIEIIEKNTNQLVFKIPYKQTTIDYQTFIDMEATKLKIHLALQKETTLYLNPHNLNEKYIDLDFLY